MNGEKVGRWVVRTQGGNEFAYDNHWLESESVRPISLSLPLRPPSQPYKGERVAGYFDNLLPDVRSIREHMKRRLKAASIRPFDLLSEAGRDCVGALQLLAPDDSPTGYKKIRGKEISENDIARHLESLGRGALGQIDGEDDFRISLAGAQEKTALLFHNNRWMMPAGATPTTHILKLPIGVAPQGIDLSTSVENEWLCGRILNAYGLPVAKSEIQTFGDQKVLVVERFDRKLANDESWIIRLPQEDFCQATATPPSAKYESDGGPGIVQIMDILSGSTNALQDREYFFRTQLIFWLLCATDGHAKNFSIFLEQGGGYRLTPIYDVLSAYPVLGNKAGHLSPKKIKLAMAVEGKNRHYHWANIVRRHWDTTAQKCAFARTVDVMVEDLIEKTSEVVRAVENEVPKNFPEQIAAAILDGLRTGARRLANPSVRQSNLLPI